MSTNFHCCHYYNDDEYEDKEDKEEEDVYNIFEGLNIMTQVL